MAVIGVVLSAGASRRMGRPKALIERDDETFLARIVRVLVEGGATEIRIVVGGPHRESVEAEARRIAGRFDGPFEIRVNPRPDGDQFSSAQIGLDGIAREDVALLHPVDIPGIEPRDVAGLIARAGSDPSADAVVPSHARRRGHPLLLRGGIARRIIGAAQGSTVRTVLSAEDVRIEHVKTENPAVLRDFDRPEDLEEDHPPEPKD